MSFLHPGLALAAVGAIALPIVIHLLFRRRRVPVDWAAMELLREAVRRTNRRLKFEQWLVLALRALAVLCAGLGLAVPFLGREGGLGAESRTWIVVVDDGATSALRVGAEDELARVRAEAARIVAGRGPRDRVGIVLASTPPRLVLAPTGDAAQIERELGALQSSEAPSDLRGALALARRTIEADGAAEGAAAGRGSSARASIVLASGFRVGAVGAVAVDADTARGADLATGAAAAAAAAAADDASDDASRIELVALTPAREAPTDVHVASVEARPAPAGGTVAVRVVLARQGASLEAGKSDVRVAGDGFASSPARTVAWERGQSEAVAEFQLSPAAAGGGGARRSAIEVRLDDDALRPGNAAWTIVDVRSEVEVGIVGRRGALDASDLDKVPASLWVSRALSPAIGSGMRVRDIDPSACDARALVGLDAVVVARPDLLSQESCDALGAFVRAGGVAVVLPAGETRAQSWGSTLLPKLGVTMRVGAESVEFQTPRTLAEEQPASRMLASIRPELATLVAPVTVTRAVPIEGVTAGDTVLAFADGSPFAVAQVPSERDGAAPSGLVLLLASSPELGWTNLPVKPLMVPFFQEVVRTALQMSADRYRVAVGERVRATPGLRLRVGDGAMVVVEQDGFSREPLRAAGVLRGEDGTMLAVNQRAERLSIAPMTEDAVRAAFRGAGALRFAPAAGAQDGAAGGEADSRADRGQTGRIAFVMLVIALAALLFEGFLSKLFSHASLERAGRSSGFVATIGRIGQRGGAQQSHQHADRKKDQDRVPAGGRR